MSAGLRMGERLGILGFLALLLAGTAQGAVDCPAPGTWVSPAGEPLDVGGLYADLATRDAVLLGERHDRMDHHRWQLGTLAALHGHRPDLVIGLEMLPRSRQPVLDAWVAGELGPETFLEESGWYTHWGFDPDLYWPILHFARVHGVPLLALNLEREHIRRLGHDGWEAVDAETRDGVSAPAEPSEGYRAYLEAVLERHPAGMGPDADRFIATQVAWDRMMAGAIADRIDAGGERPPLVAAIIGSGHLEYGYGVPHQLDDLGVTDAVVLLPREPGKCEESDPVLADALFGVPKDDRFETSGALLGVHLEADDEPGIRVLRVQPGSVGEAAGLQAGDRVLQAGERPIRAASDLQRVVQAVAPGTWLPLEIERAGERLERVARFPRED
ncbi:ChaN family lipoprotein [Thioalkalivibrio sp. AKL19]|uniref:ChaN family lipoprotein n=1 Tax=Thioalkalivibrio sp. AKL19 TaxID=1266914 RepID=UPI0004625CC5|nr:ChaN family lipoprotein [Thioalkalivibrio sp. AKL19]